ncbi:patched domain-containing protein 3-like [Macrobrachium rosenbergii]|uniref:patched domain-containing protein 3-like n=1 Tax=Macrobrachium rosenbergii TaxID=79674 RepID=UPI0034D43504
MVAVDADKKETKSPCESCQDGLSAFSSFIVNALESAFFSYGLLVGKYPLAFILLCLAFTGVCSIGLINFGSDDSEVQFMSDKSLFKEVVDWTKENFAYKTHRQIIIFESENVLDKHALLEMFHIRNEVLNMVVDDIAWDSICAKMPIRKPCSESLPSEFNNYCEMQASMERVCQEESILGLWDYDEELLSSRSQKQIIEDINRNSETLARASYFLGSKNAVNAKDRDLTKAKATTHTWYTDASKIQRQNSLKWEGGFVEKMNNFSGKTENVSLYFAATSSFGKIVSDDITGDVRYLVAGFFLVFFYVTVMLGKFNLVEQRPVLSLLGLSSVGLSIAVSYGLSSAFGIPFGAMNSILPFLLLGLGVDDMFVIITAWNNIPKMYQDKELCERIGMAMQHAGVSITVTSVTNFLAFIIGSSSDLPALRYFCLYAAIGIAAIYFFQATFFVACLVFDQRRLENNRQGLLWCWKIKDWQPSQCSQTELCKTFFTKFYGIYLIRAPSQIFVLFFTSVLFFISCWGASKIQQEFDPKWFLPPDSYLAKFLQKMKFHYPTSGEPGLMYFSNISHIELAKSVELVKKMKESNYIDRVESWYENFLSYLLELSGDVSSINQTESEFLGNLTSFLYSCEGSRYRSNFRFDRPINCTSDLPDIVGSTISYVHKEIQTTNEKMKAIENITSIVNSLEFNGFVFPFTQIYITWETNYVIGRELLQNILLALLMVFLVTLFLLANLHASFLVMVCVFATLVDVVALMHWWGLTIDTISAIDLVLAVGLSVDYAAHVAHTYLTVDGDTDERAMATVGLIGPAVLNGGFTTFLSFLPLAASDSYVFITFFKIFFAVCLYGVYHGLVVLPVLLSLVGPAPYLTAQQVATLSSPGHENQVFPTAVRTVEPLPTLQRTPSPASHPAGSNSSSPHKDALVSNPDAAQSLSSQTDQDESSPPTTDQADSSSSPTDEPDISSAPDRPDSSSSPTDVREFLSSPADQTDSPSPPTDQQESVCTPADQPELCSLTPNDRELSGRARSRISRSSSTASVPPHLVTKPFLE